jgi:hypothetical protein
VRDKTPEHVPAEVHVPSPRTAAADRVDELLAQAAQANVAVREAIEDGRPRDARDYSVVAGIALDKAMALARMGTDVAEHVGGREDRAARVVAILDRLAGGRVG